MKEFHHMKSEDLNVLQYLFLPNHSLFLMLILFNLLASLPD